VSGRLRWDGLEDLKVALRQLPSRLTEKATTIVVRTVEEAETSLIQAYPLGPQRKRRQSGNLRRGVLIVTQERNSVGQFGVALTLKSKAPHAWIYEHGTGARQTKRGFGRGAMPARPVFGRTMARKRRQMWHALADMMRAEGLRVTEHAA
jgi:hypothetical protein